MQSLSLKHLAPPFPQAAAMLFPPKLNMQKCLLLKQAYEFLLVKSCKELFTFNHFVDELPGYESVSWPQFQEARKKPYFAKLKWDHPAPFVHDAQFDVRT